MTAVSPDLELQAQLYQQIAAAVTPVQVEVHPPHQRALPFVQIGETRVTDSPVGHEIEVDLHAWSSTEGPHEVKEMQHKIRNALHAGHMVGSAWRFLPIREFDTRSFLDIDNETWHGVQRLRVLCVPVTV